MIILLFVLKGGENFWRTFSLGQMSDFYTSSQSYDFGIYNYNASVVASKSIFHSTYVHRRKKISQDAIGYSRSFKFLQRWRSNSQSWDWLLIYINSYLLTYLSLTDQLVSKLGSPANIDRKKKLKL
jgi:hypothetical protein